MNLKKDNIQEVISQLAGKKVLVLGDFILDIYLCGRSTRLSPEAPVPVVDVEKRNVFAGGAANVACNLTQLGAEVCFCTVMGDDATADESIEWLGKNGIGTAPVIRVAGRTTISKTRIVSEGHVITRFDTGSTNEIDAETAGRIGQYLRGIYEQFDAVVLSDYDKGLFTPAMLEVLMSLQELSDKPIAVDSKRLPVFAPLRPTLVKPNYEEARKFLGLPATPDRIRQMRDSIGELSEKLNAEIITLTLDADGSLICRNGEEHHRCFAKKVSMPHVAGAGDTFLSAFMMCWLVTDDLKTCSEIATAAATIAVRKESTSVCRIAELRSWFDPAKKLVSEEALQELCEQAREQGKRIVFTNGCFDILHSGHVQYLHQLREIGDILVVGINSDDSIRRLKGFTRPVNQLMDRIQVLAGLGSVDYVVPFGNNTDDTPVNLIRLVKPHVFAKGGDYSRETLPEADVVEANGGEIIFMPYLVGQSTTSIIQRAGKQKETAMAVK